MLAVMMVGSVITSGVFASESTPQNGSFPQGYDPNSQLNSPQYQQKLLRANNVSSNISPSADILKRSLDLGTSGEYREPNEAAYVNYCGPASTRAALRARMPASEIPSLDSVGQCENIDPNWGVYMTSVTSCLNFYLNSTFYWNGAASGATQLADWVKSDVLQNYAVVTGIYTVEIVGWYAPVYHIVTLYGYDFTYSSSADKQINYIDTASVMAGYTGSYFNKVDLSWLWDRVSQNNAQAW